jgi:hypothetical protein
VRLEERKEGRKEGRKEKDQLEGYPGRWCFGLICVCVLICTEVHDISLKVCYEYRPRLKYGFTKRYVIRRVSLELTRTVAPAARLTCLIRTLLAD